MLVEEYRNGQLIGSVMRDLQIRVVSCTNSLPYLDGMFVAYNSNIDVIKHLTDEDMRKLMELFDEAEIQKIGNKIHILIPNSF